MTTEQKLNILSLNKIEQLTQMLNQTFDVELFWPDYVAIYLDLRPMHEILDLDVETIKKALELHLDWICEGICQNALTN